MALENRTEVLIAEYLRLLRCVIIAPEITASVLSPMLPVRDLRPVALVLSPHPDDECLIGALPLRLKNELGWRVINIAVTVGSQMERRAARCEELAKACAVLGFNAVLADEKGWEGVTTETRQNNPVVWQEMVTRIATIIAHYKPRAVFIPHARDAHPSHIGTYWLGMDALAAQENDFTCAIFQTEYWQPLDEPNLMIGVGEGDVALLMSALACHSGENTRNPFDVRFPAYLIDNVRRGSERVGGAGVAAAPMDFAMLYQFGLWKNSRFLPSALKRAIGGDANLAEFFS